MIFGGILGLIVAPRFVSIAIHMFYPQNHVQNHIFIIQIGQSLKISNCGRGDGTITNKK